MTKLENLEARVARIEARNARVESDKAWETSFERRALITVFIYLLVGFFLQAIQVYQPLVNAAIPAMAFVVSTLALPFVREQWLKARNKR